MKIYNEVIILPEIDFNDGWESNMYSEMDNIDNNTDFASTDIIMSESDIEEDSITVETVNKSENYGRNNGDNTSENGDVNLG